MKITIAAIGKAKSGAERDLFATYDKRIAWSLSLHELEIKNFSSPQDHIRREGEALLTAASPCDKLVALDEKGKNISSREFATLLSRWQDEGNSRISFVIGGADGLDEQLRGRSDYILSLGRMTWPHLLARAMLAEQLYRAHTILSGHPYHRE